MQPFLLALGLLLAQDPAPQGTTPEAGAELSATTMLRMRDGGILWGSIVSHDEETLRFARLDTRGVVNLRWSLLDPDEERSLRARFGYDDAGFEELFVEADKLYLVDGTERVGLITERTANEVWLKTADGRIPIPLQRLSGPTTVVQAPALDVYTKDELYNQKLFELQASLLSEGAEAAAAHFAVAQFCEGLLDYQKALLHYQAAARSDASYEGASMPAILERTSEKAAVQSQVDLLQQIDLWRARRQYGKALDDLQRFEELYPESPLQEDLNKLKQRVAKYQERDVRAEVVRSWHHWARRLAEVAARKMTYEEVLAYLDGGMGEDLLKQVHEGLLELAPAIQPEEVRRLWDERAGGRLHQASYGDGSWLLGTERARAELPNAEAEADPEAGTQDEAREKLEEQIKRYMKNQEIAKRAQAGGDSEEEDPAAFWEQWPSPNRAHWILAYYVENSGDFELARVRWRNCRECGGTGTRHVVFTGGAVQGAQAAERLVACPTCHHVGVVRMVKYR